MNLGLWLCLISFAVIIVPDLFILRKFEKKQNWHLSGEKFDAFQLIDTVWIIICIGFLLWQLRILDSYPHRFALLAMTLSMMTTPSALFSILTGIYPERNRSGYAYYVRYKDPGRNFLAASKYPELKLVGWFQLFFVLVVIGVSSFYIFW